MNEGSNYIIIDGKILNTDKYEDASKLIHGDYSDLGSQQWLSDSTC